MWDTCGQSSELGLNGNICTPDGEREREMVVGVGVGGCMSEVSPKTSKHSTWWQ